jgi:DNA-binding response OmpR family regulator
MNNLLTNALKSMNQGGKLSLLVEEQSNTFTISIRDTGCGISEDVLPYIFEPFYHRENKQEHWQKGVGVGLSLVEQLLTLHNADIDVETIVGEGSCFTVSIKKGTEHFEGMKNVVPNESSISQKLSNSSVVSGLPAETTTESLLAEPEHGNKEGEYIILVVEDSAEMRRYIRFELSSEYCLIEATNGQEGIELAQQIVPDLVLSDVMMPVMDGLQLCSELKSNHLTSHIPVLLLTAKSSQSNRLEGLEKGADDYLTKPFDKNELNARIKSLIQSRIALKAAYQRHINDTIDNHVVLPEIEVNLLDTLKKHIVEHISDPNITISDLSQSVYMSERTLNRKLKALTDETPNQLIISMRLNQAVKSLLSSDRTIAEISHELGFTSTSYFSRKFKQRFSQTPKEYREGAR